MNEDVYFPLNMGIFHVHLSFRGCTCFFVENYPTWDPEVASTDTSRISLKVFDMVCRTMFPTERQPKQLSSRARRLVIDAAMTCFTPINGNINR